MAFRRKTSKYYIHKEIELLLIKLIQIKQLFCIYKKVYYNNGYTYILKKLPITSSIICNVIFEQIILELACLVVDCSDDDLSIKGFIIKYNEYKTDYKEKRFVYVVDSNSHKKRRLYIDTNDIKNDMDELETYIKNSNELCNYLKKWRHKSIAHNDKKINFKPRFRYEEMKLKITYNEIEKFIDSLILYMNNIYNTLFKTKFAYMDECDWELSYLNNLLEKDHIKMQNKLNKREKAVS